MTKNYRATRDQAVIDAWAAQLARRRQAAGRMAWSFAGSVLLVLAWMLWQPGVLVTVVLFCAFVALWGRLVAHHQELTCPHCGRIPRKLLMDPHRYTSRADYCPHCFYWLRAPF